MHSLVNYNVNVDATLIHASVGELVNVNHRTLIFLMQTLV